jgi:hypothetical protein
MEKAAAYAISAIIVGFGLWILIAGLCSSAPALWICAAVTPITIGLLSAFEPLESIPLRGGLRVRRRPRNHGLCARKRSPSAKCARPAARPGILIYCADYRCSHSIEMSSDQWPDNVRLSDLSRGSSARRSANEALMCGRISRGRGWGRRPTEAGLLLGND